jgi:hypothetical protein
MLAGRFPFQIARKKDKKYNLLVEGKVDEFWALFDTKCTFNSASMDLITKMLSYDP